MLIESNEKVFDVVEVGLNQSGLCLNRPKETCIQKIYHIKHEGIYLAPYFTGPGTAVDISNRLIKYLENFRNRREICKIILKDESIPSELMNAITYAVEKDYSIDWLDALMLNYEKYSQSVLSLLKRTSQITHKSNCEIILDADYHYKQRDYYRLSNSLAEMRAVVFLNENGFSDIDLLKSLKHKRNVDILASKDNKKYVIDVYHISSHTGSPKFGRKSTLVNRINKVYSDKKSQLQTSKIEYGADYQFLFIILDEINNMTALNGKDELESIAKEMYKELVCKSDCGLIMIFLGDGVILYPEIDP